jgi:acyl transferase domain-containing protein
VTQKLDDTFIGVNSRIIKAMDPLTRCLLERVYEAIMDAGILSSELALKKKKKKTVVI